MKCPYCGGEIALDDKFCTYCGRVNEQSVQHAREMEEFRGRYSRTESDLTNRTKNITRLMPRLIALLLIILTAVAAVIVGVSSWSFPGKARRRAAEKDPAAACAAMDAYINNGDWAQFVSFVEYNDMRLYSVDEFREYDCVYNCANKYCGMIVSMERLLLHRDTEVMGTDAISDELRVTCGWMSNLYDALDYYKGEELTERSRARLAELEKTANGMISFYLGIEETELDAFLAMNRNKQAVYIEEVLFGA